MAHFAKVNNGIVERVIVAEPEFFNTFVDASPGEWIQTSYNTKGGVHYNPETGEPSADQTKALRQNFAGVGWNYDRNADVFYAPQPYNSWTLNNSDWVWEPPIAYPDDDNDYTWNEAEQRWDSV